MNKILRVFGMVLVAGLILTVWNGYFVVPEGQQAVITQFGKPVGMPLTEAGFYFKSPFIQEVHYFEKRIYIWDGDPNEIQTKDKTFVFVDATARWRIKDPLAFLKAVRTVDRAQSMLDDIIDGTVRQLVNQNNLIDIIRSSDWKPDDVVAENAEKEELRVGRDRIVDVIHKEAMAQTMNYGIELVDVMFKRVNYKDTVKQKVYERMISERKRKAAEYRSTGEGQKSEILGRLQRELKEITSSAYRQAQEVRGRGDAEASRIYAEAYNQDPEFYAFLKSMESYRRVTGENTRLVLTSDSPLYRYLKKLD